MFKNNTYLKIKLNSTIFNKIINSSIQLEAFQLQSALIPYFYIAFFTSISCQLQQINKVTVELNKNKNIILLLKLLDFCLCLCSLHSKQFFKSFLLLWIRDIIHHSFSVLFVLLFLFQHSQQFLVLLNFQVFN